MNKSENRLGLENKEKTKKHWEHPCQSCHLEGSTTFTEQGSQWKMDVYSCADHLHPGMYGEEGRKIQGQRVVVRYSALTNDTIGEISFNRDELNMETLRDRARNRQGKTDCTPAQIAIGKVL
jgi:hypothetical protein